MITLQISQSDTKFSNSTAWENKLMAKWLLRPQSCCYNLLRDPASYQIVDKIFKNNVLLLCY